MNDSLHVTGDAYSAFFYIPPFGLSGQKGQQDALVHAMPVGVEYIYRAIRAVCNPKALLNEKPDDGGLTRAAGIGAPFVVNSPQFARYEVTTLGEIDSLLVTENSGKCPLMRVANADSMVLNAPNLNTKYSSPVGVSRAAPQNHRILVHWFGELASGGRPRKGRVSGVPCDYHVQIGLPSKLRPNDRGRISPNSLAEPTTARFVVVNIGEISESHRIRRSLSYEATAVDLLRLLRGTDEVPSSKQDVKRGLGLHAGGTQIPTFLLVRLNNSAVFVYRWDAVERKEQAWILCHKKESAPLSKPELGQMVGYTGFVSTQLSATLLALVSSAKEVELSSSVLESVQRSLVWQRAAYNRGCFHLLMTQGKDGWVATESDPAKKLIGYDKMFSDTIRELQKEYPQHSLESAKSLSGRLAVFDDGLRDVINVEVAIARAVAHRNPWFMARSMILKGIKEEDEKGKEAKFIDVAKRWLIGDAEDESERVDIPVVEIGDARLTDRREIEDYLAIHQALQVYASGVEEKAPLNIAVFGAPGAGKSFAVKQVVNYLSTAQRGVFKAQELTFNVSQFKTLNDLPDALHLVRNECLSGEIPVVFFDEFDASFQGQPFGWLKYFLAPMQDGEFYHAGQTFKIGRAVLVFAGGVNRSFEEMNGRVRNPSFCEAKGPDFISRLKAHLNVQGVNRPDDIETDEYRYILRRGKLIQDIVRRRLGYSRTAKDPLLLHPSVAVALLEMDRFKHGARSIEAIVKMCSTRAGHPIGPSDLPSMDQLEMHVDAAKLLELVEKYL